MAHIIRSARVDNNSRPLTPSRAEKQLTKPHQERQPRAAEKVSDKLLTDHDSQPESEIPNASHQAELIRSLRQQLAAAEQQIEARDAALAELKTTIEAEYEKAQQSGFEAGSQEAKQVLSEENNQLKHAVQEIIKRLTDEYETRLQDLEGDMLEVIYATVCKIIGDCVQDAVYIKTCVQKVSAQFLQQRALRVRLAPRDYEWLQQQGALLSAQHDAGIDSFGEISFVPDERIQYGGCIVESESGGRDARLDVQLQILKDVLFNAYKRQKEL